MPAYKKRKFQLGDYWIGQIKNSPAYYRTWNDKAAKQTRRASLGTSDFEEAKQRLTDWYIANQRPQKEEPEDVTLANVLNSYYESHGKHIASAEQVRVSMRHWLGFFGEATVGDLYSIPLQEQFHDWLRDKGQANTSINRNLAVGQSAINRAWKRGEIKACPHIPMLEKGPSAPRGRPMEPSEILRMINGAGSEHLVDYIHWMLGTAARPSAILDLRWEQVDFVNGIVQLNADGRKQNKKRRPTVKLPATLKARYFKDGHYSRSGPVISYNGEAVKSVRTAWRRTRAKVGLDNQVNAYSLRHTAARWMRKEGVSAWDVSAQLGHKSREFSMTERYAPFSPDHMEKSVAALNKLLNAIQK